MCTIAKLTERVDDSKGQLEACRRTVSTLEKSVTEERHLLEQRDERLELLVASEARLHEETLQLHNSIADMQRAVEKAHAALEEDRRQTAHDIGQREQNWEQQMSAHQAETAKTEAELKVSLQYCKAFFSATISVTPPLMGFKRDAMRQGVGDPNCHQLQR